MKEKKLTERNIQGLVSQLAKTYKDDSGINFIDASNLPVRSKILEILDLLLEVLFPGYTGKRAITKSNIDFIIGDILWQIHTELSEQMERAYQYQCRIRKCDDCDCRTMAENVAQQLERRISFRRAMKKAVSSAMSFGAGGIKIRCAGRLGGADMSRTEGYKEGKIP